MIAFATFWVAGAAAWAHYALLGRVVIGPFTVWRVWFVAVLIACLADILRHKAHELRPVWAVLALSFLASFMTWDLSARPMLDNASRMAAVGGLLLLISARPAVALASGLHAVVILTAFAAYQIGVIPTHLDRPRAFLAWSFPDISAGLQHAALIVLGLAAGMGNDDLGRVAGRGSGNRLRGLAVP